MKLALAPARRRARPSGGELQPRSGSTSALMAAIAKRVPLGDALRKLLAELRPHGLVSDLVASWQGPLDAPARYQVRRPPRRAGARRAPAADPAASAARACATPRCSSTRPRRGGQARLSVVGRRARPAGRVRGPAGRARPARRAAGVTLTGRSMPTRGAAEASRRQADAVQVRRLARVRATPTPGGDRAQAAAWSTGVGTASPAAPPTARPARARRQARTEAARRGSARYLPLGCRRARATTSSGRCARAAIARATSASGATWASSRSRPIATGSRRTASSASPPELDDVHLRVCPEQRRHAAGCRGSPGRRSPGQRRTGASTASLARIAERPRAGSATSSWPEVQRGDPAPRRPTRVAQPRGSRARRARRDAARRQRDAGGRLDRQRAGRRDRDRGRRAEAGARRSRSTTVPRAASRAAWAGRQRRAHARRTARCSAHARAGRLHRARA